MNTISKLTLLFISIFIFSCSDDDNANPEVIEEDFLNGTLILNEGTSAGGSVSFLNSEESRITNKIFQTVNGEGAGLFLQSVFFDDDRAYIISNGSNLISVVNRYTFELIGKVDTGLSVPRYGVVYNGKAYVTNQADFGTIQDDFIAVIDLETLEVEDTATPGTIVERIIEFDGYLYVQNAAFGVGNRISKFDPSDMSLISSSILEPGLNSMTKANGQIFALDSEGVKVIDLSTFRVDKSIPVSDELSDVSNLRVANNQLYYTSGTSAYTSSITAQELSSEPLFDYGSDSTFGSFYGFNVNNGQIFVGDAGSFESNGRILIYSIGGQLIKELTVGDIAPNSFYFQ